MAVNNNATYLQNLVDPEVIGQLIDKKLFDAIKFAPLAKVDTTLVGQPGSTITLPYWNKISEAKVTPEGTTVTISRLVGTSTSAKIKKLTNGCELTDESVLSGYGDPINEATSQLVKSIGDAIDNEIAVELLGATKVSATSAGKVTEADVSTALVQFGEDIDGDKVLLVSASDYAELRKANGWISGTEVGAEIIMRGMVGMVDGCQVVVSNRVPTGFAFIVKPGAVGLFLKRDTIIEADRDILNKSTVMTVDKHYTTKLIDATKAIVVSNATYTTYDKTKASYAKDDYVINDGHLYQAKANITEASSGAGVGDFDATKWNKVI